MLSYIAGGLDRPPPVRQYLPDVVKTWLAVGVAPAALVAIDVFLLGSRIVRFAPAGYLTLAIVGPIVFGLSHLRLPRPWTEFVGGALAFGWLIVWAAFAWPFLLMGVAFGMQGPLALVLTLLFIWPLILIFVWPLLFTAAAIRSRVVTLVPQRRDLLKAVPMLGAASFAVLVTAAEVADRTYYAGLVRKASSLDATEAVEGFHDLAAYPLKATARSWDSCWAVLHAVNPDLRDRDLQRYSEWRERTYGVNAGKVREAAAAIYGAYEEACGSYITR